MWLSNIHLLQHKFQGDDVLGSLRKRVTTLRKKVEEDILKSLLSLCHSVHSIM